MKYAIGFMAGVVTATLAITIALLRELSQTAATSVIPEPFGRPGPRAAHPDSWRRQEAANAR